MYKQLSRLTQNQSVIVIIVIRFFFQYRKWYFAAKFNQVQADITLLLDYKKNSALLTLLLLLMLQQKAITKHSLHKDYIPTPNIYIQLRC